MSFEVLVLLLLVAVAAGLFAVHRKVRRIDVAMWGLRDSVLSTVSQSGTAVADNLYRQLESLHALNALLALALPLPPLRGWAGSPDFLLALARVVLLRRPATIVECSSGASTVVVARCCQLLGAGHVYSLENSGEYAAKTRRMLVEQGLESWATVIEAPLVEHELSGERFPWYELDGLAPERIDLLVVDGPPAALKSLARYPAGPLLLPRLTAEGVVMLDDADRPDEQEIVKRWCAANPDLVAESQPAEKGLVVLSRRQAT